MINQFIDIKSLIDKLQDENLKPKRKFSSIEELKASIDFSGIEELESRIPFSDIDPTSEGEMEVLFEFISLVRGTDKNLTIDERIHKALKKERKLFLKKMDEQNDERLPRIKFLHDRIYKENVEFEVECALNNIEDEGQKEFHTAWDVICPEPSGIQSFNALCYYYDLKELAQLDILKDKNSIRAIKKQLKKGYKENKRYRNVELLLKFLK